MPKDARITRDTFDVGPAQRVDLALRTGSDGYLCGRSRRLADARPRAAGRLQQGHQSGRRPHRHRLRGLHGRGRPADRRRPAIPAIHARAISIPPTTRARCRCSIPKIFGTTPETYEQGWPATPPAGGAVRLSAARAAAAVAAARPDRRRAPSAGGERLRGAAARDAAHRGEGRPAVRARRRGVRASSRASSAPSAARRSRSSSRTPTRSATT